jgi:SAM-dependent methyltransferase
MNAELRRRAEAISQMVFLGGGLDDFELVGRLQLITLLGAGLDFNSKVLDIGCGCLRAGYWLIHFLNPSCYFGIEPNREMLEAGLHGLFEPGVLDLKRPKFDHNAQFNSSVFGEKFDFFLARSVWTHAAKGHIQQMLDAFVRDSTNQGIFLTSYLPAGWRNRDYSGEDWVGRSHESNKPGMVHHSFKWIQSQCRQRGLQVVELNEGLYGGQVWLRVSRKTLATADSR